MDEATIEPSIEPKGQALLDSWLHRSGHPCSSLCPTCAGPTATIGVTKLAYVFEVCSCHEADYDHLVETLYHRACLEQLPCAEFVSWTTYRSRATAVDCRVCGRPESAHAAGVSANV